MDKVNLIAFILILPLGILVIIPFILLRGVEAFNFGYFKELSALNQAFVIFLFLLGIPVHELLHALGWVFFSKSGWKSIQFGVMWKYLTPYCHCKEPLSKRNLSIGVVLPFILLGLVPIAIAYINGNFTLCFAGLFFSIAASGDLIALWMLRKVKSDQKVLDHPSEMGFIIIDEK